MITRVVHGWRPGGLIAYLMGPGRAEEHRRPRVIASWDGLDGRWQPAKSGPGEFDFELGPLIRALRAPAVAAGLPEQADAEGKRGYVWHCSARVADADRVLSDAEWAGVARELLHGAGIAERDDPGGPRWFAVRHADDHIHIAAVLVRQDTGRRFWPHHDYPRLRQAAREVETRLGLTVTAAADGTAAPAPGRGELEKARRQGRSPARVELAGAVRRAAVEGHDVESFVAALRRNGYRVELRRAPSGDVLGYKVARSGDVTAAGEPVYYSGSKLAPDLSMPQLLRRWQGPVEGPVSLSEATRTVRRARRTVREARPDSAEVVHAASDVLTSLSGWDRSPLSADAATMYDRAARTPGYRNPDGDGARDLRRVARGLVRYQRRVRGDDLSAVVALAVAVAALVQEVSRWHRRADRSHQAAAADVAAEVVGRWSVALSPAARSSPTPGSVTLRPGAERLDR
ncbi:MULTISPECIES: relaxase/mobilization nuclease domain-containing protein [unclassified Pseudonocardia]|uniref:relaxase/mobilization nuclease domain-containing protein n=1 Tax=unclassified Pseudonocardia TaxID=2619320 RepID=UPI000966D448|nr:MULTISPECIES: relaxase/mobilization nuclease domain-containing protein [unclassified Pseudonocardia]MBN9103101.1 relaxase/mobilization nuclease domain-containing protein [Pseudonocardia sp.]OJY41577.1 MAG: hypothetical protein BGP03_20470 [Pseudonocardia sp. 73-21]